MLSHWTNARVHVSLCAYGRRIAVLRSRDVCDHGQLPPRGGPDRVTHWPVMLGLTVLMSPALLLGI